MVVWPPQSCADLVCGIHPRPLVAAVVVLMWDFCDGAFTQGWIYLLLTGLKAAWWNAVQLLFFALSVGR